MVRGTRTSTVYFAYENVDCTRSATCVDRLADLLFPGVLAARRFASYLIERIIAVRRIGKHATGHEEDQFESRGIREDAPFHAC